MKIRDDINLRELVSYFDTEKKHILSYLKGYLFLELHRDNAGQQIKDCMDDYKEIFYKLSKTFWFKNIALDSVIIALIGELYFWGSSDECQNCGFELDENSLCTNCGEFDVEHSIAIRNEKEDNANFEKMNL